MSQPQASYILQYVSGMVSLSADPDADNFLISAQVNFYLVNRGAAVQTAQIQIWSALPNAAPIYEAEVVVSPNSGTSTVVPVSAQVATADLGWANQWAEIRTTSPDLVPSCGFYDCAPNAEVSGQTPVNFYFAPGDFAQFALHPIHPIHPTPPGPPIGPVAP